MIRSTLRRALFATGIWLAERAARSDSYVVIYDDAQHEGEDFAENYYGFFASPVEAVDMFGAFGQPDPGRYRNVKLALVVETWDDVERMSAPPLAGRPRDTILLGQRWLEQAAAGARMAMLADPCPRTPAAIIVTNEERIGVAMGHLRVARDLLKDAGAVKTVERVRAALKSADGARRHARLEPYRTLRQETEERIAKGRAEFIVGAMPDQPRIPEGAYAVISNYREGSFEYRIAFDDLIMLGMGQEDAGDALDEAREQRVYRYVPAHCPSKHWNGGDDFCHDCGANLADGPDGKEGC
jgi:hypothetical protein